MKAKLCAAAAAVLAAGPALAADGDDAATKADVRCVVALSAMIQNPQYRDGAGAGMFYFVGRIEGRSPDFDLGAAMRREMGRMGASDFAEEARRCGAALRTRNEALKSMGETLRRR